MKTNSLKLHLALALALPLGISTAAIAQNNPAIVQPTITPPAATIPVQPGQLPSTLPQPPGVPGAPQPLPSSDAAKEVPSPDSVLTKLKQNASPVTINDMIEAQDVLTRLDLISQIEEKMSKIEEMKNKQSGLGGGFGGMPSNANAAPPINPAPAAPPIVNTAALDALREASASSSGMPPVSYGSTQILAVSGSEGNYSALLQQDGHQLNVKVGSSILGLGTISDIGPKEIVVTKPNGKTTKIGFTQN